MMKLKFQIGPQPPHPKLSLNTDSHRARRWAAVPINVQTSDPRITPARRSIAPFIQCRL